MHLMRLLLAWTTLLALAFAPESASARSGVGAKAHVGAIDLAAAVCIEAASPATSGEHRGNWRAECDGTSDVPDAARGAQAICFAGGTLVHTEDGLRPIEEIDVDDLVWARDERSGEVSLRSVTRAFVTPDQQLLEVVLEGNDGRIDHLPATGEHPFWTGDGGVKVRPD